MINNETKTIIRQEGDLNSLEVQISSNETQEKSIRSEPDFKTLSLQLQQKDGNNLSLQEILAFYQEIDNNLFVTESNLTIIASEQIYYNNIEEIKNMRIVIYKANQSGIIQGFIPSTKQMIVKKVIQLGQLEALIQKLDEYKIHYLINQKYPKTSLQLIIPVLINKYQQEYSAYANMEKAKFNLYDYSRKYKISSEQAYYLFITILDQIIGLHQLKIAHRDVKPQNILYTDEKGWILSDFGESQYYSDIEAFYSIRGTKYFLNYELQHNIGQNKKVIQNLLRNDLYALAVTIIMIQSNEYISDVENKLKYCDYLIKILNFNSIDELFVYKENNISLKLKAEFITTASIYKEMSHAEQALNNQYIQKILIPLHQFYKQQGINEELCLQILDSIDNDKRFIKQNPSEFKIFQTPGFETKALNPLLMAKQQGIQTIQQNEYTMMCLFTCGYNEQTIAFGKKFLLESYSQIVHFYLLLAYLRLLHFEEAEQQLILFNQGLLFDQLNTELQQYYFVILSYEQMVSKNQTFSFDFQPIELYQKELIPGNNIISYIYSEIKEYYQNKSQIKFKLQILNRLFESLKKTCNFFTTVNVSIFEQQIAIIELHLPIDLQIMIIRKFLDYNFDVLDLNRRAYLISKLAQSFIFLDQAQNAKNIYKQLQFIILRSDSKQQILSFRLFQLQVKTFLLKANFDEIVVKIKRSLQMLPQIKLQLYKNFILLNSFYFLSNITLFYNIKNQSQIIFIVQKSLSLAIQQQYHMAKNHELNKYHQYAQLLLLQLRNYKRQKKLLQDHYEHLNQDIKHYKHHYYEFIQKKWNTQFNTLGGKCRQYLLYQYLNIQ